MRQLHKTQLEILLKLLHNKSLRYLSLKPYPEMENNSLQFHLDQLINRGLAKKQARSYTLTSKGKDYANRIDSKNVIVQKQAKISVVICCYEEKEGDRVFLVYTQKKHPFYNHQGFPAGKVALGENITDAAERELMEEAGLKGKAELCFILHIRNYSKKNKELLQDVYMYFTRVVNPKGKIQANDEGVFEWVSQKDLRSKITKPFESMDHIMKIVDKTTNFKGVVDYKEVVTYTNKF